MDADADRVGVHIALSEDEHGGHFHFARRAGFSRHLKLNWLLRTHGFLVHYNFMADGSPILAALGLKGLGAERHWPFHVSDIVLTAALLAGGGDPIHKLMDALRKFMEASASKGVGTIK
jgi:hypothetical protein